MLRLKKIEHAQRAHSPLLAAGFSERIEIFSFCVEDFPQLAAGKIQLWKDVVAYLTTYECLPSAMPRGISFNFPSLDGRGL